MIRTCSRSTLLLLATALRAQQISGLEDLLPSGWRASVGRVIALIEYWQDESPDLGILLERFRELAVRAGVEPQTIRT